MLRKTFLELQAESLKENVRCALSRGALAQNKFFGQQNSFNKINALDDEENFKSSCEELVDEEEPVETTYFKYHDEIMEDTEKEFAQQANNPFFDNGAALPSQLERMDGLWSKFSFDHQGLSRQTLNLNPDNGEEGLNEDLKLNQLSLTNQPFQPYQLSSLESEKESALMVTLDTKKLNMGRRVTQGGISKKYIRRTACETQRFGEKRPYLRKTDSLKLKAQKSTTSAMSVDVSNLKFAIPAGVAGLSTDEQSASELRDGI